MQEAKNLKEYRKECQESLDNEYLRTALDTFAVAYRTSRANAFADFDVEQLIDEDAEMKDDTLERFDELFGNPADEASPKPLLPRARLRALQRDVRAWRRSLHQELLGLGRSLSAHASEYGEVQLPRGADAVHPEAARLAARAAERLEEVGAPASPVHHARRRPRNGPSVSR